MSEQTEGRCIAFAGERRVASGPLQAVAEAAKRELEENPDASILVFDAVTSASVEVDFRGSVADVLARLPGEESAADSGRGPGRPKLGVVPREVTLLPRHWDWLNSQPGGASVSLRKLVEAAIRANAGKDRRRRSRDSAHRFMMVMAGDRPGFEEATRALFAGDRDRFETMIGEWPDDIRVHAAELAAGAFEFDADAAE